MDRSNEQNGSRGIEDPNTSNMHIDREQTGSLTATLKLKLTPEDYAPAVERALKEQRKSTVWPGFRPGQVPMNIVKKRVGKAVLVNEVERLIGESLNQYITSNKLRVLGQPLPRNEAMTTNNWDEPGEFTFAYEMGMAPSFDVDLGNLGLEMPVVEVNDDLATKEVEDMRRRYGRLEDVEVSEAKDMLLGDLIELNEEGTVKEGGLMGRTTISLEFLKDEATRASLSGKKKGEEVKVDPHQVSENHDDLARMLGVGHDRVHHLHGPMLFRIDEVKRLLPAALDQEFFDRVYGKDEVKDEAGFLERVKQRMELMYRRDGERVFTKLVMKKLFERNPLELPDTFLKRWILETSEKPVTPEDVEASYNQYAEGLKRQLIQDRVIEKYGLEAKDGEIRSFAQHYVADQFGQYGMPVPEEAQMNEIAGRMLADRAQVQRMRDSIVEQKLITHFRTLIAPKERKVGVEEFVNLARTA